MPHRMYRVTDFALIGRHQLRVWFDDGLCREIDFGPVLKGEVLGPLRDETLFNLVELDPEVHTLVWPNGGDFDPTTLHDWPSLLPELLAMAQRWEKVTAATR